MSAKRTGVEAVAIWLCWQDDGSERTGLQIWKSLGTSDRERWLRRAIAQLVSLRRQGFELRRIRKGARK